MNRESRRTSGWKAFAALCLSTSRSISPVRKPFVLAQPNAPLANTPYSTKTLTKSQIHIEDPLWGCMNLSYEISNEWVNRHVSADALMRCYGCSRKSPQSRRKLEPEEARTPLVAAERL